MEPLRTYWWLTYKFRYLPQQNCPLLSHHWCRLIVGAMPWHPPTVLILPATQQHCCHCHHYSRQLSFRSSGKEQASSDGNLMDEKSYWYNHQRKGEMNPHTNASSLWMGYAWIKQVREEGYKWFGSRWNGCTLAVSNDDCDGGSEGPEREPPSTLFRPPPPMNYNSFQDMVIDIKIEWFHVINQFEYPHLRALSRSFQLFPWATRILDR